jgi:hypothetical protein
MNEQIKALMIEAGYAAPELAGRAQKLAELLVKASAQYIEDKFDFCGDELYVADKLREHYGVEANDDSESCPLCGEDGGTSCGMSNCQY